MALRVEVQCGEHDFALDLQTLPIQAAYLPQSHLILLELEEALKGNTMGSQTVLQFHDLMMDVVEGLETNPSQGWDSAEVKYVNGLLEALFNQLFAMSQDDKRIMFLLKKLSISWSDAGAFFYMDKYPFMLAKAYPKEQWTKEMETWFQEVYKLIEAQQLAYWQQE